MYVFPLLWSGYHIFVLETWLVFLLAQIPVKDFLKYFLTWKAKYSWKACWSGEAPATRHCDQPDRCGALTRYWNVYKHGANHARSLNASMHLQFLSQFCDLQSWKNVFLYRRVTVLLISSLQTNLSDFTRNCWPSARYKLFLIAEAWCSECGRGPVSAVRYVFWISCVESVTLLKRVLFS